MITDYPAVWAKLPDGLRSRLLDDPTTALSAEDVTALAQAGASPTLAYWVDQGPGPSNRWMIAWAFRRFIDDIAGRA